VHDALYQREFNFSAYKKNMTSKKWELSFFKEEEGKYVDVWAYPIDSKCDPVVQLDENKAHLVRQNAMHGRAEKKCEKSLFFKKKKVFAGRGQYE